MSKEQQVERLQILESKLLQLLDDGFIKGHSVWRHYEQATGENFLDIPIAPVGMEPTFCLEIRVDKSWETTCQRMTEDKPVEYWMDVHKQVSKLLYEAGIMGQDATTMYNSFTDKPTFVEAYKTGTLGMV